MSAQWSASRYTASVVKSTSRRWPDFGVPRRPSVHVLRTCRTLSVKSTSAQVSAESSPRRNPVAYAMRETRNRAVSSAIDGKPDVADRLRCSTRKVHAMTAAREVPHRRLPGSRRCLFLIRDLEAWESGCELETLDLPRGGRIVRPKRSDDV